MSDSSLRGDVSGALGDIAILRVEINVRCSRYSIARTAGTCPRCRDTTPVLALSVPPDHETLADADPDPTTGGEGEASRQGIWQVAACNALLFYIEYLPDAVARRLKEFSPCYRFARDAATLSSYWANHCERCGALLADHDLYCEPEGAFLPVDAASAGAIRLLRIDAPIEAAAAGYAPEPEFFASMNPV